jgi:NADH dehydrogenase [ubiquinone] 1 alpha subcomplex assembly factor 7
MADEPSPLASEIRRLIEVAGPMPVAEYMRLCLTHPRHGYYITGEPIGAGGDFITAPEISQMFGELIGIWMAAVWQQMGAPDNIRIIELGPGRGTMMLDAMRAIRVAEPFRAAVVLHLVEISPALQKLQQQRLQGVGVPTHWHNELEEVPGGPCIIIANEFVDALPIHQAVKRPGGWHERVIEIDGNGTLVFGLDYDPLTNFAGTLPPQLRQAPDGSIFEWRSNSFPFELGRLVRAGGAALLLDYGHVQCATGDTLQAVSQHRYADPLREPGQADLTAHVDFETLAHSAEAMGARIHGPILQRDLLLALGIEKRAVTLKNRASRDQVIEIELAMSRLTKTGPREMGELFKAIAIADPRLGALPGFGQPA